METELFSYKVTKKIFHELSQSLRAGKEKKNHMTFAFD